MCLHPLGNAFLPLSSVGCFAEGISFVSRKGGRRFLVAAGPPQSCRFDGDRGGWEGARRARHATGNRRLGFDGRCGVRTEGASQDRGISQNAAVKTPARWLALEVSPCTSQRCWKRRNKRRDNKQSRLRSSVRISATMIANDLGVYHGLFFSELSLKRCFHGKHNAEQELFYVIFMFIPQHSPVDVLPRHVQTTTFWISPQQQFSVERCGSAATRILYLGWHRWQRHGPWSLPSLRGQPSHVAGPLHQVAKPPFLRWQRGPG